jgi:hypothetical protein
MPARDPHFIAITNDTVVQTQMVSASIANLLVPLGITKGAAGGEVPAGKTLAGSGKSDALEAGCVAINLVYKKGTKLQTAKVLCSPTKLGPTLFKTLVGLKYAGNDIVKVRVPRRRIYTF